jgi:hypothetical protein
MAGVIQWVVSVLVVIILYVVLSSVMTESLEPIIENSTGLEATILPLIPAFVALAVGLIVILGGLKAAGISMGEGGI